ncbi:MAG: VIT1/CCC1 transporter family protein, partial [Candidatus Nanopelagicales bacterium]
MGINLDENHRDITGGWLRPAVFGAMDGLVSNLALMVGVAGGSAAAGASTNQAVILAGIAGLLAGAFSMAAGEYTSVESQSELAEAEVAKELAAIKNYPEQEIQELAKMFEKQGMSSETALLAASEVSQDEGKALALHSRLEFGVDVDNLPSGTVAGVASFVSFAVGAIIPLLPYVFGATGIIPTVIISL